ncbi:monocarboxylate transporter 13-like [Haliotis asinina]|uniref:monocarboxylate transporter 13-like n=1 Tax=Haliotis asinina TaxID=109174 RepID=UPI003531E127
MPPGEDSNGSYGTKHVGLEGRDVSGCDNENMNAIYHGNSTEEEPPNRSNEKSTAKQNTRYWQIGAVVSSVFANMCFGGLSNSYGVMYTYMKEPLGTTEWDLSWIGSLNGGCIVFACIFGTLLIENLGGRLTTATGGVLAVLGYTIGSQMNNIYLLYFTLGILPGIGVSLAYATGMVHVNRQFSKWRPVAVGIAVTGIAIGMLSWPPLSAAVAENMGWRGTFLMNGALTMHFLPCALWIAPRNRKETSCKCPRSSVRETVINCFKIHRLPGALAFSIAQLPFGFGYFTFSTFLPDYVTASPFSMTSSEAALIVSSSGYGSMLGRVLFCGIAMVNTQSTKYILVFSGCLVGISNLIVPLCDGPVTLHISSAVNGLAIGGWMGIILLVTVELFGLDNLPRVFGMNMMCEGLGSFLGPPVQSYLATIFGKENPFYTAGIAFAVTTVCIILSIMQTRKTFCTSGRLPTKAVVPGVDNVAFSPDNTTC